MFLNSVFRRAFYEDSRQTTWAALSLLTVGHGRLNIVLLPPRSRDAAVRERSPAARHTTFNSIMAEGFKTKPTKPR